MCLQKINLTTYSITYIALPQHYFNYKYKNIRFIFGDFNAYTIEYRIVVYIRFGFFGKFSTPICLIKVYMFISSDIFLFLYVYFNLYVLVELD